MLLLLLLLALAAASQTTVRANGQLKTQQYQQRIQENIEKRLVNAVNDLAAIHRLLHQEQHVHITFLQEAQLRGKLCLMKQVLSSQTKTGGIQRHEKSKLLSGKFCY